jgi:hypothetical protein
MRLQGVAAVVGLAALKVLSCNEWRTGQEISRHPVARPTGPPALPLA